MTKIREISGLGVQDSTKFYVSGTNLIVMHSQMGIEFTGHTLEWTILSSEHFPCPPTWFNNNTSEICCGSIDNVPQSPSGACHNKCCAHKIWSGHRQFYDLHFWEKYCDIQRLTKTNGKISSRAFRGANI